MRYRSHRIARYIFSLAIAITLAVLPMPTLPAGAMSPQEVTLTADEQAMLDLINKERIQQGMALLKIDPELQLLARRYSREMIDNDFFGHKSPVSGDLHNRLSNSDVRSDWLLAGENLAASPTVDVAFENLMASPHHRDNIVEPRYTHVGIGIVNGGPYGTMITQDFATFPKELQPVAALQSAGEILVMITGWIAGIIPTSI